jgi:2-polyprenyl-3-methyl-5-hydroxy-6-metoxy-1,4-benzoquinol methylase
MYREYGYEDAAPAHTHHYLLPPILSLCPSILHGLRVLDVGCGNGAMAGEFLSRGCAVVGIDLSEQGIAVARRSYPTGRFEILAADDQIIEKLGEPLFDVVLSTEVVEHLYDPRSYVRGCYAATKPGGRFVCSTPYHGYWKNLLLSLRGGWDAHANPLWDGGHIKLWSRQTLGKLLVDAGFTHLRFEGAGRVPFIWKSMVFGCDRPPGDL